MVHPHRSPGIGSPGAGAPVEIVEVGVEALARYATVPIGFEVRSALRVHALEAGGDAALPAEEPIAPPYWKDYDAPPDGGPERWPERFDVSTWGLFLAEARGAPVGAAAVAFGSADVHMLEGRADLAVLWDIRVRPEVRGRGVGAALFQTAVGWARRRGCRQLKVETQHNNVAACRFYARQGCQLRGVVRDAYADHPDVAHEVMLLWYLEL